MFAICDEFEFYGYRRVGAEGLVVNYKKIRRLMREHDLRPKVRRRFIVTTDSDQTIRSSRTWQRTSSRAVPTSSGPAISPMSWPTRFIYVGIILDAWSRVIVGYAIGREIDLRLTVAALNAAIYRIRPPPNSTVKYSLPTA